MAYENLWKREHGAGPTNDHGEDMASASVTSSSQAGSSDDHDYTSLDHSKSQEVQFTWSEENYRLNDLTGSDQLPRVVKLEADDKSSISAGLRPYLSQPVLLNHYLSKNDASGRTVYRDKSTGKYYEVGQTLLIPDHYEGWFEIVPPAFGRAEFYSNIGQVAKAMPRKLFTRTPVNVVIVCKSKSGEETYKERRIAPGVILKTDGVFSARWKTETQSGLFKRKDKQYVTKEIQYLRCKMADRQEVLVPFEHTGKFNAVYDRDRKEENLHAVYRMKDLISDFEFPLMGRLIYGKAPVVPCIFTGLIAFKDFQKRGTIIGSTIVNKRNVLFELPVDTPCSVQLSSDDEQLAQVSGFKDARKLCKKYAQSFAGMIKLSPNMDTDQDMKEHIPKEKKSSQGDNLQTLDLIKDMNIGDSQKEELFDSEASGEAEGESVREDKVLELLKEGDRKGETVC